MDSPLESKLPFFIEKGEAGVSSSFPDLLLLPRGSWKRLDQESVSMQWDIKLMFSLLLVSHWCRTTSQGSGLGTEALKTELNPVGSGDHGQAGLRPQLRTLQHRIPNLVTRAPCLTQRGGILQGSALTQDLLVTGCNTSTQGRFCL